MIFRDSTQYFFFSKHQNKAEFDDMDDYEVLSSDFPGLRTSAVSSASATSLASVTSTAFLSKHKNKAEFKCLDDSEVLSSDFPGLKTSAASMTSTASFHQNIYST